MAREGDCPAKHQDKETIMKLIALLCAGATALTLLISPAAAQNGAWEYGRHYGYQNDWNRGWNNNWQRQGWNDGSNWGGWNSRNVGGRFFSDPSYNSDVRFRANPYRCTEDLGYGRYEYCGW